MSRQEQTGETEEPGPSQTNRKRELSEVAEIGRPALAALTTISSFLVIGTVVYHRLEDWTWIESLYFSAATLTTVGYGDIAPTTDASRLFTVFFLLTGVAAVVSSLGIIGGRYLNVRSRKLAERWDEHNGGDA